MSTVLRLTVLVALAGVLSSCTSSGPTSRPTQVPSPTPTTPPAPQPPPTTEEPPPPETTFVMSGYVRNQLTNGTIANARLEVVQGANVGKTASSDSGGLSVNGDLTMNFQLAPAMPYVYSGIVTDGTGRPVAGATVRGGSNSGSR